MVMARDESTVVVIQIFGLILNPGNMKSENICARISWWETPSMGQWAIGNGQLAMGNWQWASDRYLYVANIYGFHITFYFLLEKQLCYSYTQLVLVAPGSCRLSEIMPDRNLNQKCSSLP